MSFDYQSRIPKEYKLRREVYKQVMWMIKDYDNMVIEYNSAIEGHGINMDGLPHGTEVGDPTGQTVIRTYQLHEKILAIEECIKVIPEEYRSGVWNHIVKNKKYPDYAARSTWDRQKARYVFAVAVKLHLI